MSFCKKCGQPVAEGSKFCGKCGASIKDDKLYEENNSSNKGNLNINEPNFEQKSSGEDRKKIIIGIVLIVAIVFVIFKIATSSNEPCDWCGNSPSRVYKLHDGSKAYVCRECSKECAWCGDKATEHYENLLGMIVFVCDDCYDSIADD